MRLLKSRVAAEEDLVAITNEGYELLQWVRSDYYMKRNQGGFQPETDIPRYAGASQKWRGAVIQVLSSIFPSRLEINKFLNPRRSSVYTEGNVQWNNIMISIEGRISILNELLSVDLARYTDLPIQSRLYVEDIDSFRKVRDINPASVSYMLQPNGFLDVTEDSVQQALEEILSVTFHRKDWGGETNDLYTSNVVVNGSRVATAFLLKGNGLRVREMRIRDCGQNGDQLLRLVRSPAQLFVVQYVGEVSDDVISDIEGKVNERRLHGEPAWYCIMNGQDTARVLRAYGKLGRTIGQAPFTD